VRSDERYKCRTTNDSSKAEELQKLSWDQGVMGRAYYVTGAHLCQVIDERKGRSALIDVYSKGPISIINLYNSIADEDLLLVLPEHKKLS
jgi:TRAP-type uncharacterized transport system substrate-binding protein